MATPVPEEIKKIFSCLNNWRNLKIKSEAKEDGSI